VPQRVPYAPRPLPLCATKAGHDSGSNERVAAGRQAALERRFEVIDLAGHVGADLSPRENFALSDRVVRESGEVFAVAALCARDLAACDELLMGVVADRLQEREACCGFVCFAIQQ
jgi:hypothetical protein